MRRALRFLGTARVRPALADQIMLGVSIAAVVATLATSILEHAS